VLRASNYSGDFAAIERRLRSLEQRLDRLNQVTTKAAANGATGLMQVGDRLADAVTAALADAADRLRGGARSVSDEAAKVGHEAARIGGDAVQRISREVSQRPLIVLGVAVGLGILVGLAGRRR
jgi:hypothetical protein